MMLSHYVTIAAAAAYEALVDRNVSWDTSGRR